MKHILQKFRVVFDRRQKAWIFILFVMMLIGAALETIGIGLFPTVVTSIMDGDSLKSNSIVIFICDLLNIDISNAVIFIILGLMAVYLVKGAFLLFQSYAQYRFVFNNRYRMQREVMEHYLNRNYSFFLNISTGEVINSLTSNVTMIFELLNITLSYFMELVVVVVMLAAILFVSPVMAIGIGLILGLLALCIDKVIKPQMRRAGDEFHASNIIANKWILQSIEGIKDIKVGQRERFFADNYTKYGRNAANAQRKQQFMICVPRITIESVSMASMLGLMAILYMTGDDFNRILPELSAFAIAAVRLVPGANRMSTYRNQMSYYIPMLDNIVDFIKDARENDTYDEKNSTDKGHAEILHIKKECSLNSVSFSYENSTELILDDVNISIPVGRSVGIVGASGAGKSTAVDIMLGLLKPTKGNVLADGMDIEKCYSGWLSRVGYIPQTIYMLDDSIKNNVAFGMNEDEIDDDKVRDALEKACLGQFVDSLHDGVNTQIGERGIRLSGGQRQRIGIARALYNDPDILFFDEATSALDGETESDIMDSIERLYGEKTLIIIAHRLTTIEKCDMVFRVENGKIKRER